MQDTGSGFIVFLALCLIRIQWNLNLDFTDIWIAVKKNNPQVENINWILFKEHKNTLCKYIWSKNDKTVIIQCFTQILSKSH